MKQLEEEFLVKVSISLLSHHNDLPFAYGQRVQSCELKQQSKEKCSFDFMDHDHIPGDPMSISIGPASGAHGDKSAFLVRKASRVNQLVETVNRLQLTEEKQEIVFDHFSCAGSTYVV